ncbi:UbiD family decarboxylase [Candidatus Bathycorpusculum sp.]|uniref:UbiD family decarboxylase n=1 Tax=Candidatus Bathycorpusculum sp. TaxID=2994959 RepID=UPI00282CE9BD|nr:UbiD family decarboxylase [Candidatus Termitimicrobium sp.]
MGLRSFIEELDKTGELTKITKPVSFEYEIAGIIAALGEKPVFFENIKESTVPVVAGLGSSKALICRNLGIPKDQLLPRLLGAIEQPVAPKLIQNAPCQEVIKTDVDLTKLPIMRYTDKDGGRYVASAVSIIKDPKTGIQNMCFHRLMLRDKNHFIARIVENRGTDTALAKAGGELDIAICIGNSMAVLLSAATSLPEGTNELGMANVLEKTDVVKCKTVDLEVPADAEFVLEGKITKEKAVEGPFLDLTGIVDRTRQQPIVEIKCITHRTNPIYQTILAGRNEHKFLMGMPKEPTIYKEVGKVCQIKDVYITPGGCSWLHAVVQIKKQTPEDGKKAIEATFKGHGSLKHCIIVDEDIDIYDPQDVEWAIATRFQADKSTVILSNQPGSSLDPSGDLTEGKKATTSKAGLDATAPLVSTGKALVK